MNVNYLKVFVAVTAAVLLTSASARASETDERIESFVKDSYVFKTYLKDDSINVQSRDGAVTLTGTVKEESHKVLAQDTVESLSGVESVDNQLVFNGERPAEKSDAWLTVQVKTSLLFHRNVSGIKTQVSVTDGVVTLTGEAETQAQKDLATEYVRDIAAVKDVKNEMTMASALTEPKQTMGEKIDDASITAQVKTALLFHRSTGGLRIHVATNDGIVTLTGNVSSGAEKDLAGKYANDVNGVISVVNLTTIDDSLSKK